MQTAEPRNQKRVVKVFFAWQDEKEEKWLEKMAGEGWQLESVAPFVYWFARSAPEKTAYRLDYKHTLDKDYQEYLAFFKDAGWELAATLSNWHYFRIRPQNEVVPEIYNSDRAKAQKYRRLLLGMIPFFPLFMVLLTRITSGPHETSGSTIIWFYVAIQILMVVILSLWVFALIKIVDRIKKLESSQKE